MSPLSWDNQGSTVYDLYKSHHYLFIRKSFWFITIFETPNGDSLVKNLSFILCISSFLIFLPLDMVD